MNIYHTSTVAVCTRLTMFIQVMTLKAEQPSLISKLKGSGEMGGNVSLVNGHIDDEIIDDTEDFNDFDDFEDDDEGDYE